MTNNKNAALYKDNETLPIFCLPARCDYIIGKKTQIQLLDEVGLKIKVNDRIAFPMVVFENDQ